MCEGIRVDRVRGGCVGESWGVALGRDGGGSKERLCEAWSQAKDCVWGRVVQPLPVCANRNQVACLCLAQGCTKAPL